MNILATFDGSPWSEVTVPQLQWLARLPEARFTLLSIARPPRGTSEHQPHADTSAGGPGLAAAAIVIPAPEPVMVEDRGEAIARVLAERTDYLRDIASRMPAASACSVEVIVAEDVTASIIRYAIEHEPDLIVMATHGESRVLHRLFGDTAEGVMCSGVAPVLLVHSGAAHTPHDA